MTGVVPSTTELDLFERHPLPSWLCEPDSYKVIHVNQSVVKAFGYAKDFWGSRNLRNYIVHEEDHSGFTLGLITATGGKESVACSTAMIRYMGMEVRLVTAHASPQRPSPELSRRNGFEEAVVKSSIVAVGDRNGIITYVNENFSKASGYTAGELRGKRFSVLNSSFHEPVVWQEMWRTITAGLAWRGEIRNRAKDGSTYWIDLFITPLRDRNGYVTEFLSVAHDITRQKAMEALLEGASSQFGDTLVFGKIGSAVLDKAGRTLTLSRELMILLEMTPREFCRLEVDNFLAQYLPGTFQEIVRNSLQPKYHDLSLEAQMLTEKGKMIWVEIKNLLGEGNGLIVIKDISEKHRHLQDSLDKGSLLENVFGSITDGFFVLDRNFNFTLVNQVFSGLAGKSAAEITGRNMFELFPFMKGSSTAEHYRSVMERNESANFRITPGDKNGRAYDVAAYPFKDGIFVYFNDITKTWNQEQELIRSRNLLHAFFNSSKDVHIILDNAGNILAYNPIAAELLALLTGEAPGIGSSLAGAAHCLGLTPGQLKTAGRMPLRYESVVPDGENAGQIFDITISPNHNEDGVQTGLSLHAVDITIQRRAQEALEQSDARLRNVTDNLPGGAIFQLRQEDLVSRFTYFSSGVEMLTGFTPQEIIDNPGIITERIHPADRDRVLGRLTNRVKALDPYHEEYRIKHRNGTYRWLQVRARPFRHNASTIISDGIVLDITNQKNLQQKLVAFEHRLRLATRTAQIGVWEWNVRTDELIWDETMRTIFGFGADDPVTLEEFWSFIYPDDVEMLAGLIDNAMTQKTSFSANYRIATKGAGLTKYLMMFAQPELDYQGNIDKVVGVSFDVSLLKRSEITIRESESRFRLLADAAPVLIWMEDANRNAIYLSKGWYDFTGRSAGEELGRGWMDHIHPDDRDHVEAALARAFNSMKPYAEEYRLRRHDGAYRWILDTGVPRILNNGKLEGYIGSALDITERKLAEEALAISESRYRSVVEYQADMICRFDRNGNIVFVNRAFTDAFGALAADDGRSFFSLLRDDDAHRVKGLADKLFNGDRTPCAMELPVTNAGGSTVWHEWQLIPIGDELGFIVEIQGIGRDITYRRNLENEQKSLDKIVRESYNEVYLVNYDSHKLEYANKAALSNVGYSMDELRKLTLFDLYNSSQELVVNTMLQSLKRETHDRLQFQLRHRRRDGSQYDVKTLVQVLEKGKTFVIIANDITEELKSERKLLATIQEKETLIREIHHRVKNNLQLISSLLYLKFLNIPDPETKGFLNETRQKIKSIALIHERLIQTSSMDRLDLADYLRKLVGDLHAAVTQPNAMVQIETSLESKMVNLDTAIFCGLMVNELVTNAVKHAFQGRNSGRITIVFRREADRSFFLQVSDDGVTLPDHIDPERSSSYGMQLITMFVKQMGGRLTVVRDGGTAFNITFVNLP